MRKMLGTFHVFLVAILILSADIILLATPSSRSSSPERIAGVNMESTEDDDSDSEGSRYWPQWRGPNMDGVAPHGDPPVEWSESKNVAWKVDVPGLGASTPIIWKDLILIQTAEPAGGKLTSSQSLKEWQVEGRALFEGQQYVISTRRQQFVLLALDRETGKERWRRTLHEEHPHEGIHPTNTWASASPATDGEHILAFFGSWGLFVLDMEGKLIWKKDLGSMDTRNGWGEGSSPALFKDRVVVNWDHEGQSFIAAFDKRTGKELWRRERDEVTSWFTPLVVSHDGRDQIVTTGAGHVRGYDLENGDMIWQGPGLTVNSIPTPVASDGKVYVTSGYRGNALLAIALDRAKGDLETWGAITWRYDRDTPYVASPLLYRDTLYFFKHFKGILTTLDVRTGSPIYGPVRLNELRMVYASPVAAAGRVYLASREGTAVVLEHGSQLKILAVNQLDDGFDASPAVVDNELYLRGKEHLYKVAVQ
jgi:outer membrane protein assembly factor BamB